MRDGDISFDETQKRAYVRLPRPTVLSARLDNDLTYVHTRTTDALAKRAQTLETRARQEAERSLQDAALAGGILLRAQTNAARSIETLIRSLGFEHVEVQFLEE